MPARLRGGRHVHFVEGLFPARSGPLRDAGRLRGRAEGRGAHGAGPSEWGRADREAARRALQEPHWAARRRSLRTDTTGFWWTAAGCLAAWDSSAFAEDAASLWGACFGALAAFSASAFAWCRGKKIDSRSAASEGGAGQSPERRTKGGAGRRRRAPEPQPGAWPPPSRRRASASLPPSARPPGSARARRCARRPPPLGRVGCTLLLPAIPRR